MPNADDIARAVEPGSLEYGKREQLRQSLQQATARGGGAPAAAPAVPAAPQGGLDPLALLQGRASDSPITDGLSVGPGAPPVMSELHSDKAAKLRLIALNARSPKLQMMARLALRRMAREEQGQ